MLDAIEKALKGLRVPLPKYHAERYSFAWWRSSMRRLFANRLVIATGAIEILTATLFAFIRVAGSAAATSGTRGVHADHAGSGGYIDERKPGTRSSFQTPIAAFTFAAVSGRSRNREPTA